MRNFLFLFVCLSFVGPVTATAAEQLAKFTGENSTSTPEFTVAAPWLLDWTVSSDFPQMAKIDVRLIDASTGEFVGEVIQLSGTGAGLKLFSADGKYRFEVIGTQVDWVFLIETIDAARAEELRRASTADEQASPISSAVVLLQEDFDKFTGWTYHDERTLVLVGQNGLGARIEFLGDCDGLESTSRLSFVTGLRAHPRGYNSVLLDDGTRCYFASVRPWAN